MMPSSKRCNSGWICSSFKAQLAQQSAQLKLTGHSRSLRGLSLEVEGSVQQRDSRAVAIAIELPLFDQHQALDGEPADVTQIVQSYADWLSKSEIPKLFINAEPGTILTGPQRDFCRTWQNQDEITVAGIHFVQEDSPDEIGAGIAEWLPTN